LEARTCGQVSLEGLVDSSGFYRSRTDVHHKEAGMAVARVTEISSTSTTSFEDAIKSGLDRANATLRNVKSAWIKEQQVRLEGGSITEYQVNMLVTFVLDD
jgi:flavin-binding protein dodecin